MIDMMFNKVYATLKYLLLFEMMDEAPSFVLVLHLLVSVITWISIVLFVIHFVVVLTGMYIVPLIGPYFTFLLFLILLVVFTVLTRKEEK